MIVSHKHKFIFIKTVKTAGTSIEVDLNKVLGEADIATPIFPLLEGHKAQNYIVTSEAGGSIECRNHMSAREVKSIVGASVWEEYFKFCVEREPVSKVISHYSMLINSPDHNHNTKDLTFEEYVYKGEFPVDTSKYTDENGSLMVDRILRYEDLDRDLMAVAGELGFTLEFFARAKSGFRMDLQVTKRQTQLIYEAFSSSNRYTGYRIVE